MQPKLPPLPARAALAFEVAAAVDLYLTQLNQLSVSAPSQCPQHLLELTETIRVIRLQCAALPALHASYIELLIGHSELVFAIGHWGTEAPDPAAPGRAALLSAQRARAGLLLRKGLEPLTQGAAAQGPDRATG